MINNSVNDSYPTIWQNLQFTCDKYFFYGRRVTKVDGISQHENLLVCIVRIASWATVFIPLTFLALYIASNIVQSFSRRNNLSDKLIIDRLIDSRIHRAISRAFEKAFINPNIKKIFIMDVNDGRSTQPFEFEGPFYSHFKQLFTTNHPIVDRYLSTNSKATLIGGGKALLIFLVDSEATGKHLADRDGLLQDSGMKVYQREYQQYCNGGNISLLVKPWGIELSTILPPQVRAVLAAG